MLDLESLRRAASEALAAVADPVKAEAMAAYLKTDMPCYGVQKPSRKPILRSLVAEFPPRSVAQYRRGVDALWSLEHREEKYLALGYARHFDEFVTSRQVPLYRRMIRDGAWWDLVDDAAIHLFGRALRKDRESVTPVSRSMVTARSMWERRTAVICQIGHRSDTDAAMLFDTCTALLSEREFFIRKAVGWALRDYAKTDPVAVRSYVERHGADMSGLSAREAMKHLDGP